MNKYNLNGFLYRIIAGNFMPLRVEYNYYLIVLEKSVITFRFNLSALKVHVFIIR